MIPNQISNHRQESRISRHRPLPSGDPRDPVLPADEPVPRPPHGLPDVVGAHELPVGEVTVPQDGEKRLHRVLPGAVGRRPEERDVGGDLQLPRPVPSRPAGHHGGVPALGDPPADVAEMAVRLPGVGPATYMSGRGVGSGERAGLSVTVVAEPAPRRRFA